MKLKLYREDCRDAMAAMPRASVDAIVTDPPYGLDFMGRGWDHGVPGRTFWKAALRVTKPGGFLFAFGGSRLFHRMTCAIEDAGWEVRDVAMWLYGSGFPKSLDVGKAIDRKRDDRPQVLQVTKWIRETRDAAGVTNAEIDAAFGLNGMAGHWTSSKSQPAVPTLEQVPMLMKVLRVSSPPAAIVNLLWTLNGRKGEPGPNWDKREKVREKLGKNTKLHSNARAISAQGAARSAQHTFDVTAPATALAQQFDGYGTSLKPAFEPIVVAMKPTDGTFADNAKAHGLAGLNIDAGRVGSAGATKRSHSAPVGPSGWRTGHSIDPVDAGRWPANVALDEEAAAQLDEAVGTLKSGANPTRRSSDKFGRSTYGEFEGATECTPRRGADSGGPSRFFYSGKATKRDREYVDKDGNLQQSDHPTVKPVELMRWLIRLANPPRRNTVILDPFTGSGSTGVACALEGVGRFVGCERVPHFADIAEARIRQAMAENHSEAGKP